MYLEQKKQDFIRWVRCVYEFTGFYEICCFHEGVKAGLESKVVDQHGRTRKINPKLSLTLIFPALVLVPEESNAIYCSYR